MGFFKKNCGSAHNFKCVGEDAEMVLCLAHFASKVDKLTAHDSNNRRMVTKREACSIFLLL